MVDIYSPTCRIEFHRARSVTAIEYNDDRVIEPTSCSVTSADARGRGVSDRCDVPGRCAGDGGHGSPDVPRLAVGPDRTGGLERPVVRRTPHGGVLAALS